MPVDINTLALRPSAGALRDYEYFMPKTTQIEDLQLEVIINGNY